MGAGDFNKLHHKVCYKENPWALLGWELCRGTSLVFPSFWSFRWDFDDHIHLSKQVWAQFVPALIPAQREVWESKQWPPAWEVSESCGSVRCFVPAKLRPSAPLWSQLMAALVHVGRGTGTGQQLQIRILWLNHKYWLAVGIRITGVEMALWQKTAGRVFLSSLSKGARYKTGEWYN